MAGKDWRKMKYLHTYENGKIKWQGRILKKLDQWKYEVLLYSWITGFATDTV